MKNKIQNKDELYHKAMHIMAFFDFEKVHNHMKSVNWTYQGNDGKCSVPIVDQLKDTAHNLLVDLIKDDACYSSTGGFTVFKDPYGDLYLFFSIEEWSA